MGTSNIGWTEKTWNPTTGCTKVSQGCKKCYAEKMHKRLMKIFQKFLKIGRSTKGFEKYSEPFEVFRQHVNEIDKPLHWKKPSLIFVNSMSDLHHKDATFDFLEMVYDTMRLANWHNFQILTKRPANMSKFLEWYLEKKNLEVLPHNIWVGTSIENQYNDFRIHELQQCDATVRFISFEPLLGKIVLPDLIGIGWIIIGGESGNNARPMKKDWAERLIYLAEQEGIPVFFKQWGGVRAGGDNTINGRKYEEYPMTIPTVQQKGNA